MKCMGTVFESGILFLPLHNNMYDSEFVLFVFFLHAE